MRILFVNTLYKPHIQGGAEFSTQQLAEYFNKKKGYEVAVLSTADKDNEGIYSINNVVNFRVYIPQFFWRYNSTEQSFSKKVLWRFGDLYNPLANKSLEKVNKKFSPNFIHTNNIAGFSVYVWRFFKSRNIPILHTLRDYYMMCNYSSMYKGGRCNSQCLGCQILNYHKKKYSNLVSSVVGVSNHILHAHISHNYFNKVSLNEIIGNSIEKRSAFERERTGNNFIFGYIGTITPLKGIEILLKAFRRIDDSKAKLLIAGNEFRPGYIDELKQRFDGNIEFLGYTEKSEFFKKIDVLVHPAIWNEPFGRIVVEAFSFGKPVISSDRGGLSEINHHGKTGYVLRNNDLSSLTKVMQSYIDEPEKLQTQAEAARKAANNYTIDKIGSRYIKLYKRILDENN